MIDHDRLFKELLTTFFVEFVDLFLPDVSGYLQRDSLHFLDKELFTDVTSGERREADLVVRARFRERDSFFLIHVENQASAQEAFAKRMFGYFARLHEKYDLPVYPVALLSYDAPQRPEPDRYRVEFPGFVVNDFAFRVIQLNRLNWRDYVRQPNPVASALMAKMQIAPEERPRVKMECLRLLATLRLDPARMQLISGFVDTYLRLNAEEQRIFQTELGAVAPPEQETVMQIVTSWMEEGIEKGRVEGEQEAARRLILRLLTRRFGEMEPALRERVAALPTERLEELGEALLAFESSEEIAAWLDEPREQ
jgi:hypothetical protein